MLPIVRYAEAYTALEHRLFNLIYPIYAMYPIYAIYPIYAMYPIYAIYSIYPIYAIYYLFCPWAHCSRRGESTARDP